MTARPATAATLTTSVWPGFTAAEAAAWSRSLLRFRPAPVSVGSLAELSGQVAQNRPVGSLDWPERAAEARSIGFTPELFDSWRCSLDRVPAALYAAHPHNHAIEWPGHQPGHPFDTRVWAGWAFLVAQGLDTDAATHYALARAEESGFTALGREEYELGRTYARGYEEALTTRCRAYGIAGAGSTGTRASAQAHTRPEVHAAGTQDTRSQNRRLRAHREDQPAFRERSIAARAAAESAHAQPDIREGFALTRQRHLRSQQR